MNRPIILSPPPLEQHQLPQGYNAQRQQSVGYNLQHEFETLKADLDLDLQKPSAGSDSPSSKPPSNNPSPGSNTSPGLLAPLASKLRFSNLSDGLLLDLPVQLNVLLSQSFLPPLLTVPSRPQSVNDFSNFFGRQQQHQMLLDQQEQRASNFYLDLLSYSNWIETLSPQDTITMIEYLCNNLPIDILLTFKSKLEHHLNNQPSQQPTYNLVVSPFQAPSDYVSDMDALSLEHQGPDLYQPKPKLNAFRSHLFQDPKTQRPKSADPTLLNRTLQPPAYANKPHALATERTKSPTSHLHEKTNFLQLAAAGNNSTAIPYASVAAQAIGKNPGGKSASDETLDAHAALKLGALATINSRVALDSSRKNHGTNFYLQGRANGSGNYAAAAHSASNANISSTYEESINRAVNLALVPVTRFHPLSPSNSKKKENVSAASQASALSMPAEIASLELLNNIPAWLKLLRLHKYTECLKDIPWRQLVELDDQKLEDIGVKALGARRKLLKAFDAVRATYP